MELLARATRKITQSAQHVNGVKSPSGRWGSVVAKGAASVRQEPFVVVALKSATQKQSQAGSSLDLGISQIYNANQAFWMGQLRV